MRPVTAGCLLSIFRFVEVHCFCPVPISRGTHLKNSASPRALSSGLFLASSGGMDLGVPFKKRSPAEVFSELSKFAEETSAGFDSYGSGLTLQGFEAECAELLGKESACFFLTGTQGQNAAIAAHDPKCKTVGLHPTSHIVHHNCLLEGEAQDRDFHSLAQRHLPAGYDVVRFGRMDAAPTFDDIQAVIEGGNVGILVLELPQRMNGGAVIAWDDLMQVRELATKRGVKLHMDGARIWEVQPFYQKPLAEICDVFDSVYVSFYKGVAAMSGAMLLGPADFIRRARTAQGAMGGKGNTMAPYALHCQLQLRRSVPQFAARFQRLQHVVALLSDPALKLDSILRFDPPRPQSAMIHVYLKGESKEELEASQQAAEAASGVRLWNFLRGRGHSQSEFYFEWLMGEENSQVPDDRLLAGWAAFRDHRLLQHPNE